MKGLTYCDERVSLTCDESIFDERINLLEMKGLTYGLTYKLFSYYLIQAQVPESV